MRRRALALCLAVSTSLAAPATAAPVSPSAATPAQREQAQALFLKGRDLYNAKKYEQALAELRASMDVVASPNARLLAARCYREMNRPVEAYAEFGRASIEAKELAREDPRYTKTSESALEERELVAPQLGFVVLQVERAEPSTTLKFGGDEVRRGGWSEPMPVRPGQTEIVVETPGRKPLRQTVTVAAGEKKAVKIDAGAAELDAPPSPLPASPAAPFAAPAAGTSTEPSGTSASAPPSMDSGSKSGREKLRPWAFVAGGVGAAGLLTFAIAGSMSNATFDDLKKACGGGPCPADRSDDISAGRSQQTIANVGLVVGIVGVAAGVTLFVLSMPPKNAPSASTSFVVRPQWAGLEGGFQ